MPALAEILAGWKGIFPHVLKVARTGRRERRVATHGPVQENRRETCSVFGR
jgi:hypothetical protein